MTAFARCAAALTDMVEAVGGAVEISNKPAHEGGRHVYPRVVVLLGDDIFTAHMPTLGACVNEVERWLKGRVL